jgi:hypothetical protein
MTEPPEVDQEILDELDARGVDEARHFTTNHGLLGVLRTEKLLSRKHLADEEILALIRMNNCYRRWDAAYFGHVNLSIQRINGYLYNISSGNWHLGEDLWWTVLGFEREVLAHSGVVFATTNNGYSVVRRKIGVEGLRDIYADSVVTWAGGRSQTLTRTGHSPNQPTDPQAEALYPEAVSTAWLKTIYVPQPHLADTVHGYLAATGHRDVLVRYDPEAFA